MIKVIVKPGSKENKIEFDEQEQRYIVSVKEPADKNKANIALVKLLSKNFKKKARIKSGLKSREKLIELL